jgi:glycosyltransferase involved in cell wall biosynthesis
MKLARKDDGPTWCFVLPWSVKGLHGGVNQVVVNLLRVFESDPHCKWRTLAIETDWSGSVVEDDAVCQTPVIKFPLRISPLDTKTIWAAFSFIVHLPHDLFRLQKLAREEEIQLFNVHYVDAEALVFAILKSLRLFRGQLIFSLHGSDLRKGFQKRGLRRKLWKWMLRSADAVVACSQGLREETLMLEPRARVATIYNGIDFARFSANANSEIAWPGDLVGRKVIVQIGSFQGRKGHDLLVSAFRAVHYKYPETALLLIGEKGPVTQNIRQLIADLKLQDAVYLLEDVPHPQVFSYLSRADIFVLASRWKKGVEGEGFAIALLEAGAANLPVVATASCGVPEIIQDGVTGRLVPLEDVDALSEAICEMLERPDFAARTAANLRERVQNEFTWLRAAEGYRQLAEKLLSGSSAPSVIESDVERRA